MPSRLPELDRMLGEVFCPTSVGQETRKRFVALDGDGNREFGVRRVGEQFIYSGQGPLLGQPVPDGVPVVEEECVGGKWRRV